MKARLLAGFLGAGWMGGLQLVCVPLFIGVLGAEGFGLIGFYVTLQVSLQVLDLGLSPTLNRQLARYSAQPDKAGEARDFVWTLQCLYWSIGAAIGAGIAGMAPLIATHWLRADAMTPEEVAPIVAMMGVLVALQWPLSFYHSGMTGLQRQVSLNAIRAVAATLSYGGAVGVLWLWSPRVQSFFQWQVVVSAVQLAVVGAVLWRSLPGAGHRARFRPGLIREVLPFAREMAAIALAGVVVSQMDKVVMSYFLPLELFGYYALAGVLAGSLQLFITPIFSVVFPRLSALVAQGGEGVRQLYHQGTQLMAALVLPTAAILGLFAVQAVTLWTGDGAVAEHVAPILVLLVAGTAMNGLMHLPYALQLASGWTRLGLQFAVLKVIVFVPLLIWAAPRYGAVGGAAVWALLNAAYLALGVPLTHRRLLQGDAPRWLLVDVGYPLFAVALVAGAAAYAVPEDATRWAALMQLACAGAAALLAAVLAAPELRRPLLARVGGLR